MGATAAMAASFTKPFFAAQRVIVGACPPPKMTKSFPELIAETHLSMSEAPYY